MNAISILAEKVASIPGYSKMRFRSGSEMSGLSFVTRAEFESGIKKSGECYRPRTLIILPVEIKYCSFKLIGCGGYLLCYLRKGNA